MDPRNPRRIKLCVGRTLLSAAVALGFALALALGFDLDLALGFALALALAFDLDLAFALALALALGFALALAVALDLDLKVLPRIPSLTAIARRAILQSPRTRLTLSKCGDFH